MPGLAKKPRSVSDDGSPVRVQEPAGDDCQALAISNEWNLEQIVNGSHSSETDLLKTLVRVSKKVCAYVSPGVAQRLWQLGQDETLALEWRPAEDPPQASGMETEEAIPPDPGDNTTNGVPGDTVLVYTLVHWQTEKNKLVLLELAGAQAGIICHLATTFADYYDQVQHWLLQHKIVESENVAGHVRFLGPSLYRGHWWCAVELAHSSINIHSPLLWAGLDSFLFCVQRMHSQLGSRLFGQDEYGDFRLLQPEDEESGNMFLILQAVTEWRQPVHALAELDHGNVSSSEVLTGALCPDPE